MIPTIFISGEQRGRSGKIPSFRVGMKAKPSLLLPESYVFSHSALA